MENNEKCNYKMGNVVDSEGLAEWMRFLDERKNFVPLMFSPIPQDSYQNVKSIEKVGKWKSK